MTCRADFSGPVLPPSVGTPALRKYLLTMMSVASWLQVAGTSASSIWKTTEPSGFAILEDRLTQPTEAKGSLPAVVNFRVIFMLPPLLQSASAPPRRAQTHGRPDR